MHERKDGNTRPARRIVISVACRNVLTSEGAQAQTLRGYFNLPTAIPPKGRPLLLKSLIKGVLTNVPGVESLLRQRSTGGTDTAAYSYGVWMKHLTLLWANGVRRLPDTVAELGPGDSLGIGLSAVLCGANTCYSLDIQEYANTAVNLRIFDELVELFRSRRGRPTAGWPSFDEHLDARLFPSHILTDAVLEASLAKPRLEQIRNAIADPEGRCGGITIRYVVPWSDPSVVMRESIDLVLSQSVLEHVVDLEATYQALQVWLRPGGCMSHQIDFDAHGLADKWNGYRTYSENLWRTVMGKRIYLINREPCSTHVRLLEKNGFRVTRCLKRVRTDGIERAQLSPRWKDISDEDLTCISTFLVAVKPAH